MNKTLLSYSILYIHINSVFKKVRKHFEQFFTTKWNVLSSFFSLLTKLQKLLPFAKIITTLTAGNEHTGIKFLMGEQCWNWVMFLCYCEVTWFDGFFELWPNDMKLLSDLLGIAKETSSCQLSKILIFSKIGRFSKLRILDTTQ